MLNIPNSNFFLKINESDNRPDEVKQRDILLARKQIDLKTGESIIVFSRTTPEKIKQFKSLRPLAKAAVEEADKLVKQSYLKKNGKDMPFDLFKSLQDKLTFKDGSKFIPTRKAMKYAARQASNGIQSKNTDKSSFFSTNSAKKISPPKGAYSAEIFENSVMHSIKKNRIN